MFDKKLITDRLQYCNLFSNFDAVRETTIFPLLKFGHLLIC